jgi:SAM-dependent methyltransferase
MKESNENIDWAKHYDFYEVEMREMYRTVSKSQNDSHFEMLRQRAGDYLKKDKIFCEIGFSAGLTLRYALSHFRNVFGLDISPRNVEFTTQELLNEGYTNFELFTSDIMKYESRFRNKFDVISFIHGLEHFSSSDYPVFFDNIKNYLKEDGIFTGALPYKLPFNFRMCPHCYKTFEIDGHISIHDLNSIKMEFINNGFEIIHLSNFNKRYYLKTEGYLKYTYKKLHSILKNKPLNRQIEFIVKKHSNFL